MSVIPKITCRRCGREYSGLRSRCPYCGTSRKKSAERIPLRTSSANAGTPAAEHAAVNTKWQLLFGGILLIAVVAAVIVLITVSLNAEKNSSAAVDPTPPATVSSAAPVIPFFKLNPEIKFCFGLTDILRHDRPDLDENPEMFKITQSLSKVKSKMFVLTFYFE